METKILYIAPVIEVIELDREISLQMTSDFPPEGPGEDLLSSTQLQYPDPVKTNRG